MTPEKNFQKLQRDFEHDSELLLEVKNDIGSTIIKSKDRVNIDKMIALHSSFDQYIIEELVEKGHTDPLQFQLFRKKGNANVRAGLAVTIRLSSQQEEQEEPAQKIEAPMHYQNPSIGQGLGSPQEIIGLNVDSRMLAVKTIELEAEKKRRADLEEKCKELEQSNRSLEKSIEKNENSAVIWEKIIAAAPTVMSGLAGIFSAPVGGLNAPSQPVQQGVQIPEGSKGTIIHGILNDQDFNDQKAMAVYHLLMAYSKKDNGFIKEFEDLLTVYDYTHGTSTSTGE